MRSSFGGDLKCSPFHIRMICILRCTAPPANCLPSLSTTLRECRYAMDFLTLVKLRYFYALSFRSASSVVWWHEPSQHIKMCREKCRRTDDNHELVVISMFLQMNSCFLVTCTCRCKLYVIPWTFTINSFPLFQIVGSKIVLLTFLIFYPMK